MQVSRAVRWLLPALLLSVISTLSYAGVLKGVGLCKPVLPALGQAATPPDAAPAAQPQTPKKPIANRKHLNVSVGAVRMHIPVSGKRPAPVTAPANSDSRADVRVETTNTSAQLAKAPTPGTAAKQQGLSTVAIPGIAAGAAREDRGQVKSQGSNTAPNEEKTRPFTIKGNDQQAYQPPQGIDPASTNVEAVTVVNNGAPGSPSNIEAAHIEQPITFRWTPVIPKPQGQVTYRVSVWQLMQGQTGAQAIKANQPIITKDVDNMTQAAWPPDFITGGCKPSYLCSYVWTVQALDQVGHPIGEYNDSQQVAAFQYDAQSGAFTVQQPNSPIINNEYAPGPKKQTKSTRQKQNQKQYILGVNLTFLMVSPPQGGGNQPGGAPPMATPGPSTRGAQFNQDPGVGQRPTQVDLEAGKLKQNPKYVRAGENPATGTNGNPQTRGDAIKGNAPILEGSELHPRKSSGAPPIEGMKANQPIVTKDVGGQGRIDPAVEEGRSMTAPGSGSGTPQPAGTPITAINITLPANPDANVKVNGSTGGGTGKAQGYMAGVINGHIQADKQAPNQNGKATRQTGSQLNTNTRSVAAPGAGSGKPQPAGTPISAINITLPGNPDDAKRVNGSANGNQPTQQPGVVRGNILQDGGEATRRSSAGRYATGPDTCNGQTLAAGGTCTLVTANPNGGAAQTFTVTNTGGSPTSSLDTRPPKAQQPGQERDVINKGLPITNKDIDRTEPKVTGTGTGAKPDAPAIYDHGGYTHVEQGGTMTGIQERPTPPPPGQERDVINKGLPITNKNIEPTERPKSPHETVTPSSATPIPIEHDPAGMAAPGTTPGGSAPQAKPAKKKSKIGIHVVF